jgi:hypothetical protein
MTRGVPVVQHATLSGKRGAPNAQPAAEISAIMGHRGSPLRCSAACSS